MKFSLAAIALSVFMIVGAQKANAVCGSCDTCNTCAVAVEYEPVCRTCEPCDPCRRGYFGGVFNPMNW